MTTNETTATPFGIFKNNTIKNYGFPETEADALFLNLIEALEVKELSKRRKMINDLGIEGV